MSVKIVNAEKELPEYSRETKDVVPLVEEWLEDQDDRFKRKKLNALHVKRIHQNLLLLFVQKNVVILI